MLYRHKKVILHLAMEAVESIDPGPSALHEKYSFSNSASGCILIRDGSYGYYLLFNSLKLPLTSTYTHVNKSYICNLPSKNGRHFLPC